MHQRPGALLQHCDPRGPHIDLIIAAGACCAALSLLPPLRAGRVAACWLPPHRRRYLGYAGPVSGGRGRVERLWRGQLWWWRRPGGQVFDLPGCGRLELVRSGPGLLADLRAANILRAWMRAIPSSPCRRPIRPAAKPRQSSRG
ncbi:MAG: hypothetical protein ACOCYP_05050 [Planctomycetota bacterium]